MPHNTKVKKIVLNGSGYFLSRSAGCFKVRKVGTRQEIAKYPITEGEIGEIQMISGNLVSTDALVSAAMNNIPVIIKTSTGSPVGFLWSIDDMSHVDTRVCQVCCIESFEALWVCYQIVMAKLKGQNEVLAKYGLKRIDYRNFSDVRYAYNTALTPKQLRQYKKDGTFPWEEVAVFRGVARSIEGHVSKRYWMQVLSLFPEELQPNGRKGYGAYDGLNNTFNLAYRILQGRVYGALVAAKLEPYLGFYHTTKFGDTSLVYDFMEIHRYLIDDFVIRWGKSLRSHDFELKKNFFTPRGGERLMLNRQKNKEFIDLLVRFFETRVSLPRVRRGYSQELETLINEEALLLAKYIRSVWNEKEGKSWTPRLVALE